MKFSEILEGDLVSLDAPDEVFWFPRFSYHLLSRDDVGIVIESESDETSSRRILVYFPSFGMRYFHESQERSFKVVSRTVEDDKNVTS